MKTMGKRVPSREILSNAHEGIIRAYGLFRGLPCVLHGVQ